MALGVRPAGLDRAQHAAVGAAHDSLRSTGQRAEGRAPVERMGAAERFGAPAFRLAGAVSHRTEDIEGDASGIRLPFVERPDAERQLVEEKRALSRPSGRTVRLEGARREELDPIGHELAVV